FGHRFLQGKSRCRVMGAGGPDSSDLRAPARRPRGSGHGSTVTALAVLFKGKGREYGRSVWALLGTAGTVDAERSDGNEGTMVCWRAVPSPHEAAVAPACRRAASGPLPPDSEALRCPYRPEPASHRD